MNVCLAYRVGDRAIVTHRTVPQRMRARAGLNERGMMAAHLIEGSSPDHFPASVPERKIMTEHGQDEQSIAAAELACCLNAAP